MRPDRGDGTPLPLAGPAAGVGKAWPPGGPSGPAWAGSGLVEAELVAVPPEDTMRVTVVAVRAVTVPCWLLPAVRVRLT